MAKLNYLQMLGYDISWNKVNVIEVCQDNHKEAGDAENISGDLSNICPQKRIGYLAAIQSFYQHTEVLMLVTNMIRKDLSSTSM